MIFLTVTIASRAEELFLSQKEMQILRQRILFLILNLYQQGYRDFYTNGAWGVPLWSAELLCILKKSYPELSLHLVLPHEHQADQWLMPMKKRYQKIKLFADTIQYISVSGDRHSFQKADRFMIDQSDLLLFYGKQEFLNYSPQYCSTGIEIYAKSNYTPIRYI